LDRLIPPRQREVHAAHVRRFSESGMTHFRIGEMQPLAAVRSDGTEFPVEAAISQAVVGGRKVLTVIMRDVSPKLRMMEKMLEHEQALVDFFTAAPLGLMWMTIDGRVERVNQAELDILGRTSDEVVGRAIAEFHIEQDMVLEITRQVAQRQTVRNRRVRVRRKDGSVRHVLIDANSLWKGGQPVHSRWFVRDITDRVDLELEILAIAERERERIGQDLHDDLCQQLTAIEYMSEAVGGQLEAASPQAAEAVHEVSRSLRHAVEYARELARGLFPRTAMGNGGLVVALEDLAERTRKVYQRDCRFRCDAPISVEGETIGIHLFRIAQEAVVNAIRHGKAGRIDIQLKAFGNDLVLSVTDDGVGLPAQPHRGKGMGLRIMQYRASAINGSILVRPGINTGTAVVCTVKDVLQKSSSHSA
jgi:two-component system CheB/CheR fusion protein